jgi:hypothetical protein
MKMFLQDIYETAGFKNELVSPPGARLTKGGHRRRGEGFGETCYVGLFL